MHHVLANVYVTESPNCLGEGEENVFLKDMGDGLLISGCQDGVDHVQIYLEEVVLAEEGSHGGISVEEGVTGGVNCIVAKVDPQTQEFKYLGAGITSQ